MEEAGVLCAFTIENRRVEVDDPVEVLPRVRHRRRIHPGRLRIPRRTQRRRAVKARLAKRLLGDARRFHKRSAKIASLVSSDAACCRLIPLAGLANANFLLLHGDAGMGRHREGHEGGARDNRAPRR